MKESFSVEDWRKAAKEDFSITDEQQAQLVAAMETLKELAKSLGVPVHIQMAVGHRGSSTSMYGASTFIDPSRVPLEMLASHICAVEGAARGLEFLADEAEYQSSRPLTPHLFLVH